MVAVVVFGFGVMRCQPLRRALAISNKIGTNFEFSGYFSIN